MAKINYNSETREQVVKLVLKNEKSANQIAKELGIGPNTVGRWVNEYRKEHNLPTYREERRIRKVSIEELAAKNRELEKRLRQKEKEPADEKKAREEALVNKVRDTFEENNRVYGCPKMQASLHDKGVDVKVWKLRRIMRENGLYPVTLKRWKPYRKGKCDAMYSENLVQRQFNPDSLNSVWAGDITYVKTALGWVYLAVVLDLCNKEAVGYAVSKNIDTELVKRALSNAIMQRGHHDGLIFHSDRGVQYSSMGYRTMLSENGITPSMSAPGCPYDNACMESFFASFKKELAYRRDFKDLEDMQEAVFRYIELFYNRKRLHSSLGYMTPVEYRLKKEAA